MICHRFRAQPLQQEMADLPVCRVQLGRPFQKVGIDFAGPSLVKSSSFRKSAVMKSYVALYICLVTEAVHLELVSSLSTKYFLFVF